MVLPPFSASDWLLPYCLSLTLPPFSPPQASDAGPLPLSVLLGGALVDRMDLLGRAAVHVAVAAGRADVVRQLVGAGCAVNKPLPMDFR